MSKTSETEWEHIKKQIKKTLEKTPSKNKQTQQQKSLSWEDIEKKLRKKHQNQKIKTSAERPAKKNIIPTQKDDKLEDWVTIQQEIDDIFKKTPKRYQQTPSKHKPEETTHPFDQIIPGPQIDKTIPLQKSKKKHPIFNKKERQINNREDKKHYMHWGWNAQKKKKIKRTKKQIEHIQDPFRSRLKKKIPFQKEHHQKRKKPKYIIKKLTKKIPFTINIKKIRSVQPKKIFYENIVEIILFILGLSLLLTLTPMNMKIGLTLILIASFLLFLMIEERKPSENTVIPMNYIPVNKRQHSVSYYLKEVKKGEHEKKHFNTFSSLTNVFRRPKLLMPRFKIKNINLTLTDRITVILITWTLLLFIITSDIEIFFILIFIGILITKEMTDIYTSKGFKLRLNAYIVIFLFTYAILISQKIMTILQT